MPWFRIGVMGDPCHDWILTVLVCHSFCRFKTPVIVTKHWVTMSSDQMEALRFCKVVINTSVSALDTDDERRHRLSQFERLESAGVRSVLRIVSAKFGTTDNGRRLDGIQKALFKYPRTIDNPLRIPSTDKRVTCGDILVGRFRDLNSTTTASVFDPSTPLGKCSRWPDRCGTAYF